MKTRKLRFILIGTILVTSLSCNLGNNKLIMIESKGLNEKNLRLNTLSLYDSDIGFIAGSSDEIISNSNKGSDTFAFLNRIAFLYKTTDGGITWTKKEFGEGSFINITRIGNKIVAIKNSEITPNSFIYISDNLGENWVLQASFPNIATDIFSIDNSLLLIAKDTAGIFRLYESKTLGKSWAELKSPLPIYDAILKGPKLFYLSSNITNDHKKNIVVEYSIKDRSNKVIELPKEFSCYFLTNYNDDIKLTGIENSHIAVYSLQNGNQFKYEYSYLESNDYFPQGYYNYKGEDWIVAGKKNKTDVSNVVLKTKNNGKSWESVYFLKEKYIKPFCFTNVKNKVVAWFYSGSGKFQILN